MGRSVAAVWLVSLLLCSLLPIGDHLASGGDTLNETSPVAASGASNLNIAFSNGPAQDDDIKGTHALTFSVAGTGTLDSLLIEITEDESTWTTVVNLTTSPWMYPFDTTSYTNSTYKLRASGWDSDAEGFALASSGWFDIVNQVPVITTFTVLNPDAGSGTSLTDRAWFNIGAQEALSFRWGASDDDLKQASLASVPGPGAPATDGPSSLSYGWDWNSGNMAEGTWSPRLTVQDHSGLSATSTLFIGIDRTGPSIGSVTVGDGSAWQQSSTVTVSGLIDEADDGQGSGVASIDYALGENAWTSTTSDSITLTLSEGVHTLHLRAVDRVGNIGENSSITVRVDQTAPIGLSWAVDELTTSRVGPANVAFNAEDADSGIDNSSSYIQYGFDSNGVGETPDLSGRWLTMGVNGLSGQVGLASWATKSRQHLMLRAVLVDEAGNSFTTQASSYQILPGLDLFWNVSQTNVDRIVVRPGEQTGNVTITSVLESNEDYGGSVIVRLETAPADRSSNVDWTVMETRNLPAGTLSNSSETIVWQYTVPRSGQFDLRLVIDFANVIDEYDEGNNNNYLVVTGASLDAPGLVPSFAPSLFVLVLVGFALSLLQRRTRD
ncbi:MAG: OmpL47-type beta-barrel domain-containing protein [Poseidonia sp.]